MSAIGQKEYSKWYFGQYAGLDFATGAPSVLYGSAMQTSEGCSSIADAAGNLLFYTDGQTIWNRQNMVMGNGSGLLGNSFGSSTQGALIIKQPGQADIYFVFTLDQGGGINGLGYSIVDMSLAAGMGSVTIKNVSLYAPSAEKMTATQHCNGNDVWVLSHECNSNNFRAYLLSSSGVNTTPIISSIGSVYTSPGSVYFVYIDGQMKPSPSGRKLAATVSSYTFNPPASSAVCEVFDFDNASGLLTNSLSLGGFGDLYGCEFSPDGTKLYACAGTNIAQWDLGAGTDSAIIASKYNIIGASDIWALQLGPDKKIYGAELNQYALDVINNPNNAGSACNFTPLGQSLGSSAICKLGLPGFVNSLLKGPPVPFTYINDSIGTCLTASFVANPYPYASPILNQVAWLFGEPLSGAANMSTLTNPTHVYLNPGTYTVQLIRYYACGSDTLIQPVSIAPSAPTVSASGNFSVCAGQQVTITLSGAVSYSINNSAIVGQVVIVSPTGSAAYQVMGNNGNGGCAGSTVIHVSVSPNATATVSGYTNVCNGSSTTLTASGAATYSWATGSTSPTLIANPSSSTVYTLSIVGNSGTCNSIDLVPVKVFPLPTVSIFIGTQNSVVFCNGQAAQLTASGASTYTWTGGATGAVFTSSTLPQGLHVFNVTGADTNSCRSAASVTLIVSSCLGIEPVQETKPVRIYPNPYRDLLNIESGKSLKISLYNETGALILEENLLSGSHVIDLSFSNDGIFLLRYESEEGRGSLKLVKAN